MSFTISKRTKNPLVFVKNDRKNDMAQNLLGKIFRKQESVERRREEEKKKMTFYARVGVSE